MGGFVLGGAIGYVLGSRADRESYEQRERRCRQGWAASPYNVAAGVVSGKLDEVRGRQRP
jgi:membrane protein YqaA with SNARE-associated domain